MKAFVFDPLWTELMTEDLTAKLAASGLEMVIEHDIKPLTETKSLFEGHEPRILCLNPDYADWSLKSEDYQNIPQLKAILIAPAGFDWVDSSYATSKAIPICNIRHFSTEAVADWAIMMMFNLARRVPLLIKNDFPLDFGDDYMKYGGIELKGKRVGVIGLGHNGSAIAERCAGLSMEVVYWSRSSQNGSYKRLELEELIKTSDVIIPAFAKNQETNLLLSDKMLDLAKSTAIVVDIIGLENKNEVLERVKVEQLLGYGFEAEPNSFASYEGNVWAAPAYAWATDGSMKRSMEKWIDNMIAAQKGDFPNRIN